MLLYSILLDLQCSSIVRLTALVSVTDLLQISFSQDNTVWYLLKGFCLEVFFAISVP